MTRHDLLLASVAGDAAHDEGRVATDCPCPPGDRAAAWLAGWRLAARWRARGHRRPSEKFYDELISEGGFEWR